MQEFGWIISAIGLAIVIIGTACGITWRLSRVEIGLRSEFTEKHAKLEAKMYQVEIWARDEFVRKGSFETVVTRIENSMNALGVKFDGAVDKMTARIEHLGDNK
jgi:hypothetical protein